MEHQFEKFSLLKHQETIALPHTTPIPEKADTTCSACWGSGWETQFITPCPECNGTGHIPKKAEETQEDIWKYFLTSVIGSPYDDMHSCELQRHVNRVQQDFEIKRKA